MTDTMLQQRTVLAMTGMPPLLPMAATDLDAVATLVTAIRWPHRRADVQALIELGHGRIAHDPADGRLLGVGLWWPFGERAARIGLVIVDPAIQGRGLGRRMVETLISDAARPVMLLATRAGRPLYDKLGFVETGAVCQHQGEYRGKAVRDQRIRPATASDLTAILRVDAEATGLDRAQVLRHLMGVGRTAVLADGEAVAGYAVERAFGCGSVIGPIVAPAEADAIALFDALAAPGFVRVDRAAGATALGRHLASRGLALDSESAAMVLGGWPAALTPPRLFALASHALG